MRISQLASLNFDYFALENTFGMDKTNQFLECQLCKKRAFNSRIGIVCSLTNEKRAVEEACPDFEEDPKVDKEKARANALAQARQIIEKNKSPEQKRKEKSIAIWSTIIAILIALIFVTIRIIIRHSIRH